MTTRDPNGRPAAVGRGEDADTLRRALALVNLLRDPALPGILVGLGFVAAGVALVGVAWTGVAGTLLVPLQTPYVVSGGLGGAGLIAVGVLVASIQLDRRDRVETGDEIAQVSRELVALAGAVRARRNRAR